MALIPYTQLVLLASRCYMKRGILIRNLMSKQLIFDTFGDPEIVVKFREARVRKLGSEEVLVRMLAAPVSSADMNAIQGLCIYRPSLPHVPGDEGVGDVVELGSKVTRFQRGHRVVISGKQLGTWSYYGIYNDRDLHGIPSNIPLAEGSMLTVAPVSAYRMLTDYSDKNISEGQYVVQTGANSPTGQSLIQICKAMRINTINIVATHCGYEAVKEYLLGLGATQVYTLEEVEEVACCNFCFQRPVLAINCLGGRYEDVMLRLLQRNGHMVYYGDAYYHPFKMCMRQDVNFHRFNLSVWKQHTNCVQKEMTYRKLQELIVMGKLRAPMYVPLLLRDYKYALRNTSRSESFSTKNYVFDFSLI